MTKIKRTEFPVLFLLNLVTDFVYICYNIDDKDGGLLMATWQDFEIECTDYLNLQFGRFAKFIHLGESDSTIPDILVNIKDQKEFYIEAKQSPAQCGQFVLFPNIVTQKFDYSKQNVNKINKYSSMIIEYMNKNFEEYKEAGTTGKYIKFHHCEEVFCNWIIDYYKSKNVKYFITNNHTIFPIEQFSQFFIVTAKFRTKRSGSSSVGHLMNKIVKDYIEKHFNIQTVEVANDKLYVKTNEELHNKRFITNGYEFMFSKRNNVYEVRKLSNTFNANVIFSIELKPGKQGLSFTQFAELLKLS